MTTITCTHPTARETAPLDDHILIHHMVQGDTDAFTILYHRYTPRLAGFLKRYLQQSDVIEEVINDTMLALWQQSQDYNPTMSLASWLCGIARYKALSALRRTPISARNLPPQTNTHSADPEADIVRMQQVNQVRQAVQTLPPLLRDVVQLAYDHHYSYQEIATRLVCPVNTVKDRMRQARRRLRPILADHGFARPHQSHVSRRLAA